MKIKCAQDSLHNAIYLTTGDLGYVEPYEDVILAESLLTIQEK